MQQVALVCEWQGEPSGHSRQIQTDAEAEVKEETDRSNGCSRCCTSADDSFLCTEYEISCHI